MVMHTLLIRLAAGATVLALAACGATAPGTRATPTAKLVLPSGLAVPHPGTYQLTRTEVSPATSKVTETVTNDGSNYVVTEAQSGGVSSQKTFHVEADGIYLVKQTVTADAQPANSCVPPAPMLAYPIPLTAGRSWSAVLSCRAGVGDAAVVTTIHLTSNIVGLEQLTIGGHAVDIVRIESHGTFSSTAGGPETGASSTTYMDPVRGLVLRHVDRVDGASTNVPSDTVFDTLPPI